VLVSHPTLVDTRVEVVRRQRSPKVLEAALAQCEAGEPATLVLSGRLDRKGVNVRPIDIARSAQVQAGMKLEEGTGYRAGPWALAVVRVQNLPGQQPWTAGEAHPYSPSRHGAVLTWRKCTPPPPSLVVDYE
jgi:hypothetical protein